MTTILALIAAFLVWLAALIGPENRAATSEPAPDATELAAEHQAAFREATKGWTVPTSEPLGDGIDADKEAEEAARYAR